MTDWTREREVWTVSQAAEKLGVGDRTVRSWCEMGILATLPRGGPRGHYRISRHALSAYLGLSRPTAQAA